MPLVLCGYLATGRGPTSQPLCPQACKENADAFLFLFSFTDRASFEDLPGQLTRVAGEAPGVVKIVIGSKYPLSGPWDALLVKYLTHTFLFKGV